RNQNCDGMEILLRATELSPKAGSRARVYLAFCLNLYFGIWDAEKIMVMWQRGPETTRDYLRSWLIYMEKDAVSQRLLSSNRYADALVNLEGAHPEVMNTARYLYRLACAQRGLGKNAEALRCIQLALEVPRPESESVLFPPEYHLHYLNCILLRA